MLRRCLQDLSAAWQSIPPYLRYDSIQSRDLRIDYEMMIGFIRLEYLYTEFLLYTLLVNTDESSRERLMMTAHELLHIVLVLTRERQSTHRRRPNMEWAVREPISRFSAGGLTSTTAGLLRHAVREPSGPRASPASSTPR